MKAFKTLVLQMYVEKIPFANCAKTVWVKCANKDKQELGGLKHPSFLLFKAIQAKTVAKRAENDELRHGFGVTMWKPEIRALQEQNDCQIYGNRCA
ncbi:hypothetical protein PHMEG_00031705 [Phytophthora megakarya]|uniref:Uncharacterized protein n=1 Tax=Phytophthora megakarya TaxID=4795 RepID=A0A225UXG2_9STRA|nr:hypothetical protein PHMEG_00031705 [Phytophthora megakarya]